MIVSAHMYHQRTACKICCLEAGSKYRLVGIALCIHKECGQITQMTVTPRRVMALRIAWVEVATRRQRRNHFPILLLRVTAWILVQMEPMQSSGKPFQRW